MNTITSANSVFALAVPTVFPVPQILQGYAVDDAFSSEAVDTAEVTMGVDGLMSGGFTPFITRMVVALLANSPSISTFDTWLNAMKAAREVFRADATIEISSIGKIYVCTKGILVAAKQLPDAKRVLQTVQYTIAWESVNPVNI